MQIGTDLSCLRYILLESYSNGTSGMEAFDGKGVKREARLVDNGSGSLDIPHGPYVSTIVVCDGE
jgi:hypothetical protein